MRQELACIRIHKWGRVSNREMLSHDLTPTDKACVA